MQNSNLSPKQPKITLPRGILGIYYTYLSGSGSSYLRLSEEMVRL